MINGEKLYHFWQNVLKIATNDILLCAIITNDNMTITEVIKTFAY